MFRIDMLQPDYSLRLSSCWNRMLCL